MAVEVLSLARKITELERLDSLRTLVLGEFAASVRDTADRLIAYEQTVVADHRDRLRVTAAGIESADSEEMLRTTRRAIVEILDEHREKGESCLASLRENLTAASRTLEGMLLRMSSSGSSHQEALESGVQDLREIGKMEDLALLRAALSETTERMAGHLEEMKREHRLALTQMQDEIRALHRELAAREPSRAETASPDSEVKEPAVAPAPVEIPQGMSRASFEELLNFKAVQQESFCLVAIWMSNLAHLFAQHKPEFVLELMAASSQAVVESLAGEPFWLRWDEDCFVVCTTRAARQADAWSREIAGRLSGLRTLSIGSTSAELDLKVVTAVVERTIGETSASTLTRLSHLIRNLRMMS